MEDCSEAETADFDDQIIYGYYFTSFSLTFDGDTVQLCGGHAKDEDHVIITWTAPQPLEWIRLLAVGVHSDFAADSAFRVYRNVGQCFRASRLHPMLSHLTRSSFRRPFIFHVFHLSFH